MWDERALIFPESGERYDSARMVVLFSGNNGDKVVPCAISREALEDHFEGGEREPLKAFRKHRARIEHEVLRKYLAGRLESDGSVLIKSADL